MQFNQLIVPKEHHGWGFTALILHAATGPPRHLPAASPASRSITQFAAAGINDNYVPIANIYIRALPVLIMNRSLRHPIDPVLGRMN
ncbi:hypothetical protein D3C77_583280 [compost metagenome]